MRAFKNIGLVALGLIIGLAISSPGQISQAAPGTQSDPLVTLSYVDKRFEELDTYLESKLSSTGTTSSGGSLFEIVEVKAGGMIYLGDSSEFILRSGEGVAIASANGGLANLTEGYDIAQGKAIPKNHQILNPQNDGRGVAITKDSWVMIKGPYTVVTN
ncbi:hypothetical protein ADUPG1_007468 [Aduncisulcus paluster]|jgi:hypothetical protein|uniref:Uncharacterized protein n=1 Tax=Aduncisulcus paluster TaxID=2918883 RepID=A0ABQ5KMC1_9EUKA|nr:hypothetical protein ADUPG1_007468 [Aduncisulcus paluster]